MQGLAIMGHGVVGSGVAELFFKNRASIQARAGEALELRHVLDLRDFADLPYSDVFTKDFEQILNDPAVAVVAEVMGGLTPAYEYTKRLLEAGKSVVTSNKELVAAKGAELLALAKARNVNYLFEASVGGGIPVIRPISQCLAANTITEIAGILNGTTNYIMTKMITDGTPFADALAEAQQKGYAERDPSADVDGHDACRKICILASLAYGRHVYPEQVHTEGIGAITADDVACARAFGGAVKLIGRTRLQANGRLQCMVAPMLVPGESPLCHVDGVFNAVLVRGDATGDVMFYGRGAGKWPTASAVVADMIDCVKHLKARKYLFWDEGAPDYVADWTDETMALFVRAAVSDPAAAASELAALFGQVDYPQGQLPAGQTAFITPAMPIARARALLAQWQTGKPVNVFCVCD